MPWNAGEVNRDTLHVWGIPADDLANECIVVRLDFPAKWMTKRE